MAAPFCFTVSSRRMEMAEKEEMKTLVCSGNGKGEEKPSEQRPQHREKTLVGEHKIFVVSFLCLFVGLKVQMTTLLKIGP